MKQPAVPGTISNRALIGLTIVASLKVLSSPESFPVTFARVAARILVDDLSTGVYIGRGGVPCTRRVNDWDRRPRSFDQRGPEVIEVTTLLVGWLLAGTVGIRTAAYVLSTGVPAHVFMPTFCIIASENVISPKYPVVDSR